MPEIKYRPNYDSMLTDNRGIQLPPELVASRRLQQIKLNYENEIGGVTRRMCLEATITEVRTVNASQILAELKKKDAIIQDLMKTLSEFERKKSFAPSRHRLPLDYYENDIYSDV